MSFGHSIVLLTSSTSWKSLTMASCMTDMSTTLLAITCRSSLPRNWSSATISSMYSACMSCLPPEKTLSPSTSPSPHLRKETLKQWFMSSTTLKLWLKVLAFLLHSLQNRFDSLRNSPMSIMYICVHVFTYSWIHVLAYFSKTTVVKRFASFAAYLSIPPKL